MMSSKPDKRCMGGGFPTRYLKDVPPVVQYGRSIFRALRKHFGNQIPETIIEPGRGMKQCVAVCIACERGVMTTCSTSCTLKGAQ